LENLIQDELNQQLIIKKINNKNIINKNFEMFHIIIMIKKKIEDFVL